MTLVERGAQLLRRRSRIAIRLERPRDVAAREQLLDASFGDGRFEKSSERLREGRAPANRLAFVALDGGRVVGTLRLWPVTAGPNRPCLLLGPLAVSAEMQNRGIGAALMWRALRDARDYGHKAVLLVGDAAYYERFGFSADLTGGLAMPGPYDRHRLLACEFAPGAIAGARGLIAARNPSRPHRPGIGYRPARRPIGALQPA